MGLPFTKEQFFDVFGQFNMEVYPVLILIFLGGLLSLYLIYSKNKMAGRITSFFLSFIWLFMGAIYHILFFSPINPVAKAFGAIFIVQGILFLILGTIMNKIHFEIPKGINLLIGSFLVAFGLIIYPLIGMIAGHTYPKMPIFGAPCPTVIFTFGILLFTNRKFPKSILVIPFIWSLIGFSAAILLGVPQDIMLLISGIISIFLILKK